LRDSRVSLRNLSARLARSESCYEISFCETRKKRFSLRNFVTRLAFRNSRYEISVCETHEKWVSLLILTRESREHLARILGLKSESRFSREFQKVILVSTLIHDIAQRNNIIPSQHVAQRYKTDPWVSRKALKDIRVGWKVLSLLSALSCAPPVRYKGIFLSQYLEYFLYVYVFFRPSGDQPMVPQDQPPCNLQLPGWPIRNYLSP
jgi:hypothetical protein